MENSKTQIVPQNTSALNTEVDEQANENDGNAPSVGSFPVENESGDIVEAVKTVNEEGDKVTLDAEDGKTYQPTGEVETTVTEASEPMNAPAAEQGDGSKNASTESESDAEARKSTEDKGAEVDATPAAEALAEEKGVDLSEVDGSGKDGTVTKADVEAAAEGNA